MNPITGIRRCARATTGHAAVAPPSSVMNARRLVIEENLKIPNDSLLSIFVNRHLTVERTDRGISEVLAALETRLLGWVLGSDNLFERSGLGPRIGSQRLISCGCSERPNPPPPPLHPGASGCLNFSQSGDATITGYAQGFRRSETNI